MSVEIAANFLAGCMIFGLVVAVVTPIVSVLLRVWKPAVKIDVPISMTTKIS